MFNTVTDSDFTKNFLISCGVHLGLLLVAYLGGTMMVKVFNGNENVEVIRSSVRVDVVGMPKFTVQELKAMQADALAKAIPEVKGAAEAAKAPDHEAEDIIKKGDLVIQEVEKKKKNSFMNIVNDYSQKKVAVKVKNKGEKSGTQNKELSSLILEGNRLSKGAALVGDYSDAENSEFSSYVQGLPELVRPFWNLPSYLQGKGYRCRIRIYFSPAGRLLTAEVFETSGQPEFDARALKAIKDVASFPTPPDSVGQRLTKSGIILGFPL